MKALQNLFCQERFDDRYYLLHSSMPAMFSSSGNRFHPTEAKNCLVYHSASHRIRTLESRPG